jgi:hypothetical protein
MANRLSSKHKKRQRKNAFYPEAIVRHKIAVQRSRKAKLKKAFKMA